MKQFFWTKLLPLLSLLTLWAAPAVANERPDASIGGSVIFGRAQGELAITSLSLNCHDPVLGSYDACLDVVLVMNRQNSEIRMNPHFSPAFAKKYRTVLVRYSFRRADQYPMMLQQSINVTAANNQLITVPVFPQFATVVARTSTDGGDTWSSFTVDHRRS